MATFLEPKFPISKEQRAQRKAAANQTLEDVAEEILNGILCQYEPPNRTNNAQKRKPSGILRRPKDLKSRNKRHTTQQTNKSARVRWMDEQKEEQKIKEQQQTIHSMVSPTQGGCSMTEACMDAGIEVGCVSAPPPHTSSTYDTATVRMMNAKEAIAVARAKSPRNARTDTVDIVFDDDGNPTYDGTTKKSKQKNPEISLPAVPPPPNKKERFFPELCGVRLNCGDEAYVQVMPKYNFENSVNYAIDQCSKNMTEDDDDELIMMMDELDNSVLEDNDGSDSFGSDVETLRNSINQVRDRNRELQEAKTRTKKSSKATNMERVSKKKSMREIVDHYMVKEESDDDNNSADWEEKMSPTGSSANFLRRVWPRHQSSGTGTTKGNTMPPNTDDISDDGIVKNNNTAVNRRTNSRSRSPSRFRRGDESILAKPIIVQDVYESVELVKNEEKRTMKASIGAVLKSMTAKSPRSFKKSLSSASINETLTSSDWDETIPIVHDRSQNVQTKVSGPIPTILPQSSVSRQLSHPINNQEGSSPHAPPSNMHPPVTYLPQASQHEQLSVGPPPDSMYPQMHPAHPLINNAPAGPMHPQMHPAHPLINNGASMKLDQDDLMERQSFITAHRLGLDPANTQNSQAINDDMLERQSFIGAYRQGIEEVVNTRPSVTLTSIPESSTIRNEPATRIMNTAMPQQYYPPQVPMTTDDMMERQSFITAYRQGTDPVQRSASAPLTHDDIMERMSYITASRVGSEPLTMRQINGNTPSPPKQSRRERRSRSKSPRRNNQSIEQQNSFQPNLAHHGVLYDHMGNPVYGHPAAFYNSSAVLPTHRDPPTTNGSMQISAPHDAYPGMGEHNAPYYATQNYAQPMYMSNNLPPLNHSTTPYPAYQYAENQVSAPNIGSINDLPLNQEQLTSIDENVPTPAKDESNDEPEVTWEERTRQAWERIRGGISALTFETSVDEKKMDEDVTPEATIDQNEVRQVSSQSLPEVKNQVNTMGNVPLVPQHALYPTHALTQPHDLVKRVSFGEPQQFIYYDDQDENRSTMSLPGKSNRKKKQFRGSKLVGGVLGKVKNSLNKVAFSRSTSSDTVASLTGGRSSHSQEWDGSVIHPNHSMTSMTYSQVGQQLHHPTYMYPSHDKNQVSSQTMQQMPSYNADPRFLPSIPQSTYPNQMMNHPNTSHPNQVPVSYQQPQSQPQYYTTTSNTVSSSGYPVLSNSNMYNTAPSQYQHHYQQQQQQQQYSMPVPFRNARRSL